MLFVPVTRAPVDPDPGYSTAFFLNIDQALSITRSADNTHTRVRGLFVYLPEGQTAPVAIEALVLETPDEIAALINAAKPGTRVVRR